MKQMTVEQLEESLRRALTEAAGEDLVIMEGNEPIGVLHAIEPQSEDVDEWVDDDPELWEMIESARAESRRPLEQVEAELFSEKP
jgi:hypothetical protein